MNPDPSNLRGTISEDDVARILGDLVSIPSVNPGHLSTLEQPFGEASLASYVEDFARSIGLRSERQEVLPGRDNVLVFLPGAMPNRRLLFECHMDTVPGWHGGPDPFVPRVSQGNLYGRGACDVKGTLAAMLVAFRLLVQQGWQPSSTLVLAATVDEEHLARGVHRLARDGGVADAAVVGEPTEMTAVIAHKGCVRWRLTAQGKAAHSSRAELGVNAIESVVELIGTLQQNLVPLLSQRQHPLVGAPSLSVCTIHGGIAPNVIPDECVVEIDRRTVPGEATKDVLAEFDSIIQQALLANPSLRATWQPPFITDPALGTDPETPIVRALQRALSEITGSPTIRGVAFGTDASKLSEAGIPSVVFGPGSIEHAHTREEHVSLFDVARAAEVYAHLALTVG